MKKYATFVVFKFQSGRSPLNGGLFFCPKLKNKGNNAIAPCEYAVMALKIL